MQSYDGVGSRSIISIFRGVDICMYLGMWWQGEGFWRGVSLRAGGATQPPSPINRERDEGPRADTARAQMLLNFGYSRSIWRLSIGDNHLRLPTPPAPPPFIQKYSLRPYDLTSTEHKNQKITLSRKNYIFFIGGWIIYKDIWIHSKITLPNL